MFARVKNNVSRENCFIAATLTLNVVVVKRKRLDRIQMRFIGSYQSLYCHARSLANIKQDARRFTDHLV